MSEAQSPKPMNTKEKKRLTQQRQPRGKRGARLKNGPGKNRRQAAAILERRAKVADLYLKCWEQHRIAVEMGVSAYTISTDLDAIHDAWEQQAIDAYDAYIRREMNRIDRIEREAWEGWERSCRDRQRTTTEDGTTATGPISKTSTMTEGQAGDPRFLEQVGACVEKRAKLLGLFAPKKSAQTDPTGKHERPLGGVLLLPSTLSPEDWEKAATAQQAALAAATARGDGV